MCKTTTSNKNDKPAVYTAVPVEATPSDIESSLSPRQDVESSPQQSSDLLGNDWKQSTSCNLSLGMVTGMVLSTAGFHMLLQYVSSMSNNRYSQDDADDSTTTSSSITTHHDEAAAHHPLTMAQVLLFSALWSSSTYIVAYSLFSFLHWRNNNKSSVTTTTQHCNQQQQQADDQHTEKLECYFAVGVFAGFCLACTVTDVSYGLPAHSVIWTLFIAVVWISVMIVASRYWNTSNIINEQDDSSTVHNNNTSNNKDELRRHLLELVDDDDDDDMDEP